GGQVEQGQGNHGKRPTVQAMHSRWGRARVTPAREQAGQCSARQHNGGMWSGLVRGLEGCSTGPSTGQSMHRAMGWVRGHARACARIARQPNATASMASSLLTLLDDIASVLDDVATMTKVATKKTAGVLGDDLALNAQQVSGVKPDRELPVVWAVARGSLLNKAILVPAALLISAFAPWGVVPLMMLGGAYLCYEGVEKLAHRLLHSREEDAAKHE